MKSKNKEFDKEAYWKRREENKRGQGAEDKSIVGIKSSEVSIGFTNDGTLVAQNRAWRRQKYSLPTSKQTKKRKKRK